MLYFSTKQNGTLYYFAASEDALLFNLEKYLLRLLPAARSMSFMSVPPPVGALVHIVPSVEVV